MNDSIDAALNPALGLTRSRERPLTSRELVQRDKAVCAANPVSSKPSCTGVIFVGMFFDGTGNNEDADYKEPPRPPREQKHSNVVRLYHAFPGQDKSGYRSGTTGYYRYYIPGVGTPFEESAMTARASAARSHRRWARPVPGTANRESSGD